MPALRLKPDSTRELFRQPASLSAWPSGYRLLRIPRAEPTCRPNRHRRKPRKDPRGSHLRSTGRYVEGLRMCALSREIGLSNKVDRIRGSEIPLRSPRYQLAAPALPEAL